MADNPDLFSIREACIFDHELYRSWIEAGFTPDQAFKLLLNVKSGVCTREHVDDSPTGGT
jgi:hypothetical protein